MKIVVLERSSVGMEVPMDCLREFGELILYDNTLPEEVALRVKDAHIVVANKAPLRKETLENAKDLQLICELATGYDNIDVSYCSSRGIRVTNIRNYSTASVVQHTIAMVLYLLEHLPHYDQYVKTGEYSNQSRFTNYDLPFSELEGKTWGILGMGNIGKGVARVAAAFGCQVIYHSLSGRDYDTPYRKVSFEELLRESDVLSLHCPLTEQTKGIMNRDAFAQMKRTAILINVARGAVVAQEDLYYALKEDEIAAAGLDVLIKEPLEKDSLLLKMQDSNRLFITPHMAWASTEARNRAVKEVYENIRAYQQGTIRNVIQE